TVIKKDAVTAKEAEDRFLRNMGSFVLGISLLSAWGAISLKNDIYNMKNKMASTPGYQDRPSI
ncbi:MAG TPA: hypothetical protein VIF12_07615, partial [Micavibrio sp.]